MQLLNLQMKKVEYFGYGANFNYALDGTNIEFECDNESIRLIGGKIVYETNNNIVITIKFQEYSEKEEEWSREFEMTVTSNKGADITPLNGMSFEDEDNNVVSFSLNNGYGYVSGAGDGKSYMVINDVLYLDGELGTTFGWTLNKDGNGEYSLAYEDEKYGEAEIALETDLPSETSCFIFSISVLKTVF